MRAATPTTALVACRPGAYGGAPAASRTPRSSPRESCRRGRVWISLALRRARSRHDPGGGPRRHSASGHAPLGSGAMHREARSRCLIPLVAERGLRLTQAQACTAQRVETRRIDAPRRHLVHRTRALLLPCQRWRCWRAWGRRHQAPTAPRRPVSHQRAAPSRPRITAGPRCARKGWIPPHIVQWQPPRARRCCVQPAAA
mmetsp:Transcript_2702/g.9151  ORF Transcript_2702/g.9151 Transcript_2702/m.9151 type:complete len:200 (-) Transcript_2702:2711-3310(-)